MVVTLYCEHPGCNIQLGTITLDDISAGDLDQLHVSDLTIETLDELVCGELFGEHPAATQILARRLRHVLSGYVCEHHAPPLE